MPGYIKLFRDLQENFLWQEKPFTRAQAWIDMMFRCNHICKQMGPQHQSIWVLRGQFLLSNIKLGEAWGWSEKKVRRFMKYLVEQGMIKYFSFNKFCVYELTKYAEYQALDNEVFQESRAERKPSRRRTKAEQTPTNNNDNNDNNDKKVLKDIYMTVQHLSISKEDYEKLVAEFGKELVDSKIRYAENYAKLKNYKSLYLTLNNWLKSDVKKQLDNSGSKNKRKSGLEILKELSEEVGDE
jgi:hypothetical protein